MGTMLFQSLASALVGLECILCFTPDVFCDTMGAAFTYPVAYYLCNAIIVGYVHYPIISTVSSLHPYYTITILHCYLCCICLYLLSLYTILVILLFIAYNYCTISNLLIHLTLSLLSSLIGHAPESEGAASLLQQRLRHCFQRHDLLPEAVLLSAHRVCLQLGWPACSGGDGQ